MSDQRREQPSRAGSRRPSLSRFSRLARTHALMMGGDAAMVVALADSLFFDIDLNAARTRVLLFLAISFAPFLFVAPLIGPLIDRMAGGRKLIIQIVAASRLVLCLAMARYIDNAALFPLVFASLVLQKTYVVSKSALVPSTVRASEELVEANSKLGLVAGLTGAVAVVPAAILLQLGSASMTLVYAAGLFVAGLVSATRLASDVVASTDADAAESVQLRSPSLRLGSVAMTALRASVGFTFFHLAFWLRSLESGTLWFGAVVGASALATFVGNAIAPRIRSQFREETMLKGAMVVVAAAAVVAAVIGGPGSGVLLAATLNMAAAISRLSFESIVQRDAPGANQGRAFAGFETRFQLAWALAAFIAVAIQLDGALGFVVVAVVAGGTLANLFIAPGQRSAASAAVRRRSGGTSRRRRPAPTKGRAPRSRSESGKPRRR